MKNIRSISFPSNVADCDKSFINVGRDGVTEIRPIMKSGEMANIQWFQIIKGDIVMAEIKESVCNIYGEDILEKINNIL
jgi:hypothetical protein